MITVTKASKHHRNPIVVAGKMEIIIEVIILMVNKRDVAVIVITVVLEIHVKTMILEINEVLVEEEIEINNEPVIVKQIINKMLAVKKIINSETTKMVNK